MVGRRLSRRELEVMELVMEGYTNPEIGDKLDLSYKTIENHISSILKKLGVKNRTQAAVEILRIKQEEDEK